MKSENLSVHTKDFFIVNGKTDITKIKLELSELMSMVDSMLQLIAEELNTAISCPTRLWYVQAWLQYLQITHQLYQRAYGETASNLKSSAILLINPALDKNILRNTTTAYIYQLQSLCHIAAYNIFTSNINSHLQNSLIIIDEYMQRAVYLIDLLMLEEFRPVAA